MTLVKTGSVNLSGGTAKLFSKNCQKYNFDSQNIYVWFEMKRPKYSSHQITFCQMCFRFTNTFLPIP